LSNGQADNVLDIAHQQHQTSRKRDEQPTGLVWVNLEIDYDLYVLIITIK